MLMALSSPKKSYSLWLEPSAVRIRWLRVALLFFGCILVGRLFILQVWQSGFYSALADGQHSFYEELVPERGAIFARDFEDENWYPLASNAPGASVYAVPKEIDDPQTVARNLAGALGKLEAVNAYDDLQMVEKLAAAGRFDDAWALLGQPETKAAAELLEGSPYKAILAERDRQLAGNELSDLISRLSKENDPYEPVAKDLTESQAQVIEALAAPGVYLLSTYARSYPEPDFGGQVLGFVGKGDEGEVKGNYGIEGYFDEFLAGQKGSLFTNTDAKGRWLSVANREVSPAVDGGDIYLTIDRTLQIVACEYLRKGVAEHEADGGSLVIIEPKTGKIKAMCGVPDFNPASYGEITDYSVYSNPAIFSPYEPGSIFKPITMAAAIDVGAVTPESVFDDPGFVEIDEYKIKNSGEKVYGRVNMVQALEDSINTAMVWVMRQMGRDKLEDYIKKFGFGTLTGIELNTEAAGDISSLEKVAETYPATASFGQGISVTPLQIAAAYGALANNGQLMKPYVVEEKHFADGTVEREHPQSVRSVISSETAKKIGAMLVAVVEYGHGKRAQVPGYYIAGKTGTAQIAKGGKYSETEFIGSFAGYGPIANPQFAMVVQVVNPKKGVIYAESTAAPIFGQIAKFMVDYYHLPKERE